ILPAMAIGAGLLASFTLGIWWLHPRWLASRMKLSRLEDDDAPELVAALARICSEAGLRRPPEFYWNPLGMAPRALAYGRAGRYRLALTGAMAMRYSTDPPGFRAVILHELAHIVNRDIDKTWLAVGAWWALVASALVPRVALQFWIPFRWVDVAASVIQVAAITSLVFVTRNAMLHARELYADARASVWMSDSHAMAAALCPALDGRSFCSSPFRRSWSRRSPPSPPASSSGGPPSLHSCAERNRVRRSAAASRLGSGRCWARWWRRPADSRCLARAVLPLRRC